MFHAMKHVFLLIIFYSFIRGSFQQNTFCPASSPKVSCDSMTVIIIDATHSLADEDIHKELDYVRDNFLPSTSSSQQIALEVYGIKDFDGSLAEPFTSNYSASCSQLQVVYQEVNDGDREYTHLANMLNVFRMQYNDYLRSNLQVILFSATDYAPDIRTAGHYVEFNMNQVDFHVVAFNYSDNWNAFPYKTITVTSPDGLTSDPSVTSRLLKYSCGEFDTATTTTKKAPVVSSTTTQPPINVDFGIDSCQCETNMSWNDVMLLFDVSAGTGVNGVADLVAYVQSVFSNFNLQKIPFNETGYSTSMGIIAYGSKSVLIKPLNTVDNNDLDNLGTLPSDSSTSADIYSAINMASQQFSTSAHRPSSRKVIIILASTFDVAGHAWPTPMADKFKQDNGVLIVYNYVQSQGVQKDFQSLASPGYFIDSSTNNLQLDQALCNANCFCGSNMVPYVADPITSIPTHGCYYYVSLAGNFQLAKKRCQQLNYGDVAQEKNAGKTDFLLKNCANKQSFWGGLTWDAASHQYIWMDGTPVTGDYQPWIEGSSHTDGVDCVQVTPDEKWQPSPCRMAENFLCEARACDSSHLCF